MSYRTHQILVLSELRSVKFERNLKEEVEGRGSFFDRIRASAVFGQGKAFSPPSDHTSNTAMLLLH